MNILQHIVFPNNSIYSKDVGLYLNAPNNVRLMDNVLIIPPYEKVDFDTYFNYFSVKKWVNFGQIDSLYVKGNINGIALLEIIGVKKHQNFAQQTLLLRSKIGTTGEWLDYHQDIAGFEGYDGIFVRVCTLNEQCELGMLEFGTHKPIRQQVKLGICAFGNGNPRMFDEINQMAQRNGLQIDFLNRDVDSQNQIGSIIECLSKNQAFDGTHILTLSTDGYISSESIFRAVRFFEMVFLERRDVLIVGHSLSDGNNTKELTNPIDFILKGGSKNNVLDWSFCMFDKAIIQGYGLPLPMLPRHSANEYQQRIYKEIVPINGIAFFDIKTENKPIVQAEYYDVRDGIICELLKTNPELSKIKRLIWDRFWKNIHTYQYVSARMNLYALDHIIKGTYQKDMVDIDRFVDNLYQRENKFTKHTYIDVQKYMHQQDDISKHTLFNKVSPYFGMGKKGVVIGKHKVSDFWGKKTVVVADTNGEAHIARIRRKKAATLIAHATKSYYEFVKNHKEIKQTLLQYRNDKKQC